MKTGTSVRKPVARKSFDYIFNKRRYFIYTEMNILYNNEKNGTNFALYTSFEITCTQLLSKFL